MQVQLAVPPDFYPEREVINNHFVGFFLDRWKEMGLEETIPEIKHDFRKFIARLLVPPIRLREKWVKERPYNVKTFTCNEITFPIPDDMDNPYDIAVIIRKATNLTDVYARHLNKDPEGNWHLERAHRSSWDHNREEIKQQEQSCLKIAAERNIFDVPTAVEVNTDIAIGMMTLHELIAEEFIGKWRFDIASKAFKEHFTGTEEQTQYWSYTDIIDQGDKWNDFIIEEQLRRELCLH